MEFKNRYFDVYHIIRDLHNYKVYTNSELIERYQLGSEEVLQAVLRIADKAYS
jgi:hypothetical protein